MSETENYYDPSEWAEDYSSSEPTAPTASPEQEIPQQEQEPPPYVSREDFDALNQRFQQLQNGISQAFGNQTNGTPKTAEQQALENYMQSWAKDNGFVSKQDINQIIDSAHAENEAKNMGFPNVGAAEAYYAYKIQMEANQGKMLTEQRQVSELAQKGELSKALRLAQKYYGPPPHQNPHFGKNINTSSLPVGHSIPASNNSPLEEAFKAFKSSSDYHERRLAENRIARLLHQES